VVCASSHCSSCSRTSLDYGSWRHTRVILKPESSDPTYQPLVFADLAEGELRIIAELVEVLG